MYSQCFFPVILVTLLTTSVFGGRKKEIHVNVDEYHTCIPLAFRPPHTLNVPSQRIQILGETLTATRHHIIPLHTLSRFINLVLSENPFETRLGEYLARNVLSIYSYFEANPNAGAFPTPSRLPRDPTTLFLYSDRPNFGRSTASFDVDHRMLAAFTWIPANLFYGPPPNRRAHDPGDNLEWDAEIIVGSQAFQILRRIYENMQNYINNPTERTVTNYNTIMADLNTIASTRNRPYAFNQQDWVDGGFTREGKLYDIRKIRRVVAEEVTTPVNIHDELRKRSLFGGVTDDDYLQAAENVCEEYLKHIKPKLNTNYTQIDIDDDVMPLVVYSINDRHFVYGQNEKTRSWFIKRVDRYGKVGAILDQGTWQNYYAVQFHFEMNSKHYLFGHDLKTRYWFIQLINEDGKMGRETDHGFCAFSYKTIFYACENGRHYLFGHAESNRSWFIKELSPDGVMGPDIAYGIWPHFYDTIFIFKDGNDKYLFRIYKDRSVLDGSRSVAFPFSLAGKTYVFGQNPKTKHFYLVNFSSTLEDNYIDLEFSDARPFNINGYQYFYAKLKDKPRATRSASSEQPKSIRKEPFTHLSEKELIEEANKVRAQAEGITCTSDHPPEKFFSLPHRKKKDNRVGRRNSDEGTPDKTPLGRSTSDVSAKKRRERTSLSTLFRRAQSSKSPDAAVVISTKPIVVVKRSKSDVSDLKSNTNLNTQNKPVRKRSGSETEEFLKSLRNKKTQLSPIIESSPREDYFKKTPPLDVYQKQKSALKENKSEELKPSESKKVNPVEKPPRYNKTPDKPELKPPNRAKKSKSLEKEKEKSPQITDTPKRKTDVKKTLLVDEIDSTKNKDAHPIEVKDRIKDSIRKIEENVYGDKEMIHSSQQPPDKPPLTRGHTVDHLVRILKEDQSAPPPKSHLISPPNGTNTNQPFSYLKPSVSPDPNLFVRNTSPDRVPSPINKMDKGVVYAHVVRDHDSQINRQNKQTIHKTFSPPREKYANFSDEDEGLGYEERHKFANTRMYDYDYKHKDNEKFNTYEPYNVTDSPIRPRFREYKLRSFEDLEPTYANENSPKEKSPDLGNQFRGRADGMDTKKKHYEPETNKLDLDFNELSHRRQLLESRLNARRLDRERNVEEPITRYLAEDPIYEAEKRMKATERYVNETVRYYRNTLERDGFAESSVTEDYSKYDSDKNKIKYNTESRTFQKVPKEEFDRREFIDKLEPRYKGNKKNFPPEPEYEPPSLESNTGKPLLTPDEYKEKKYKAKKQLTSSHDLLQSGQKYKGKDEWFGKRKGHYSSNPEIAQEREEVYANLPKYADSYHSLRRVKNKDRYKEEFGMKRHDSGDSREYYRDDRSPRRLDIDNRLVDSGIENDFRKDSSGEIHRTRHRRHESDDDVRDTSLFLASERRYAEDTFPSEQIYANGDYLARFKDYRDEGYRKEYAGRDRSADEGSHFEPKTYRYDKSPSRLDDKISAKPPKAKKLSGLEKMKQLFSRDSSKKSKKEKEVVQPKTRTRVLKSPEHLAQDDSDYRRYTDPEPSDIVVKKIDYECKADDRKYRSSREDLDRYRNSDPRDSDPERNYREEYDGRYKKTLKEDRRYKERKEEKRRYNSSDRESDRQSRPSDGESDLRKSRSRPLDSPALAERYRGRRRLATPSPTPSPPRRHPAPTPPAGNWFKSLDRLTRKKGKNAKVEKESIITTEDEAPRKTYPKPAKPLTSPAKNLRFFGDTDPDSDNNVKTSKETKRYTHTKHGTLRKTISNSSTGLDEVDHAELANKSYSLSNLHRDEKSESPNSKHYKRNLQNISEIQSNSENESQFDRKVNSKPPISPYERSRSHSSSKTLKASKADVRRRHDDRGSSSELRGSKQELSRDMKHRRRTPVTNSGESSTEGDSSHQSQRSVVYLHATTVGDIPDPGRLTRNRSRDDVSSVNSSNLQVRSTTKSFSIFAPWTPKHYNEQQDVHYAQRPRKTKPKEPMKKASSTKTLTDIKPATLQKNKSYSQTTLTRRPQNNRLTSSSTTLNKRSEKRNKENGNITPRKSVARDGKKSQSSELISRESDRERLSRSISMPKDNNKKAGWFKLSSKNKKPEINTRVR